jgi:hypothetical protein
MLKFRLNAVLKASSRSIRTVDWESCERKDTATILWHHIVSETIFITVPLTQLFVIDSLYIM